MRIRSIATPVFLTLTTLLASLPGCASNGASDPPENPDGEPVSEDDLQKEEESFAPLDATADDLSKAKEASATQFEHQFTLFAIPAPKLTGLSWKSPGALARRTLINEGLGFSRAIGHVAIRVDCGAWNGRPAAHVQTGQSNIGDEFRAMIMKEKAGLGVLFRTVPGELETEALLDGTFKDRYESGRMSFLKHKISGETCHAFLDYVTAYDAGNVEKNYGFVRPSYQEGSGCSAFGMSFMKLGGLLEPYMKTDWTFDVKVPMSLIGGTTNPSNSVGVARLFVLGRPWAREGEAHIRINGWDPTLMFKSLRLQIKEVLKTNPTRVEKRGSALGLIVDKESAVAAPELKNGTYFSGAPSTTDAARFLTADY
jgi:hypothetical protein